MSTVAEDIPEVKTYKYDHSKLYLSDKINDALRAYDVNKVSELSPVAGCLLPLLMAMKLDNRWVEIIEGMPFASNSFELTDLRNVLVNLGIDSTSEKIRNSNIEKSLLPCLLSDSSDKLLVVLDRQDKGYLIYDPYGNEYKSNVELEEDSTAYFFTDLRNIAKHGSSNMGSWMSRLLGRFYPLLTNIFAMSFFINLLAVVPPLFIMLVYDQVIGAHYDKALPYLSGGVILILIFEFGLRWMRSSAIGHFAARIDYLVSTESFKHLMSVSPTVVERTDLWTQMRLVRQFDGIRELLSGTNSSLLIEIPFVFITIATIALIGGYLALIPVAVLLITLAVCYLWDKSLKVLETSGAQSRYIASQMMLETLKGKEEIKAIGMNAEWREKYRGASALAITTRQEEMRIQNYYSTFSYLLGLASAIITLWWGAHLVLEESITVGALIGVMILMWRVNAPMQGFLMLTPRFRPLLGSIDQINNLMRIATEPRSTSSTHLVNEYEGKIAFKGISFRYEADAPPALVNINFEIEPGELIVVSGESGSGKSTFLKLICRLYNAQSGSIKIDGLDLRQIDPITLRHTISYLPHDPHVFYGTIANNIRFNQPTATAEDICKAADEAGILEQIESLDEGFNTLISDQQALQMSSSLLYGICLARTFVRQCPILLLDEPGASLDYTADQRLIKNLENRRGKQTIIIATHRPSHIELASRVMALQKGMIVPTT